MFFQDIKSMRYLTHVESKEAEKYIPVLIEEAKKQHVKSLKGQL